jgi:hypothetical protein
MIELCSVVYSGRLSPALVITREQADVAVRILDEALAAVGPHGGRLQPDLDWR